MHHGKQSTLANQTPGIDADVNFHDEVAKAAEVRLGLVWRIRRNQQPIAGFHLISLAAHHWLSAVFARDDTVLIMEVLAIGDFPAENHFASASGKNIKIVSASVLLGVVEDAVDFRQTDDGLVSKYAIEHEHAEIARLDMHRPAANRLGTSAARFFHQLGRFLGRTLLYGADVPANFLDQRGASVLKSLTGYDPVTLEFKNSNESPSIICRFNVIVTCNSRLAVHLEGDVEAWRRRLAIIEYRKPKPEKIIADLPETANVMFVGHDPDFSEVVSKLIGGTVEVRKGGFARIDLTARKPRR